MFILNVNSNLDLEDGGGTAERTYQISRFLVRHDVQCAVLSLDINTNKRRLSDLYPAKVVLLTCLLKRFNVPLPNWKLVRKLVCEADIVHLMGHWSFINAIVYLAIRLERKPYVICPAGALPYFGRSKLLKYIYNIVIGYRIVRNASSCIAITEAEIPHFVRYGILPEKIKIIANGVSQEDFPEVDECSLLLNNDLINSPIILFVGRLNYIKGPDLLLNAFALVCDRLSSYHLVFAGPDNGMLDELKSIIQDKNLTDRVHFLGYVGGKDKSHIYHKAKILVVPSRQEAMSIVALEAGICGTPVLLTDQCGFSSIREVDNALEVPATASDIADGLLNVLSDPDGLAKIAAKWHDFVERRYSWDSVVLEYISLYSNLLKGENPN